MSIDVAYLRELRSRFQMKAHTEIRAGFVQGEFSPENRDKIFKAVAAGVARKIPILLACRCDLGDEYTDDRGYAFFYGGKDAEAILPFMEEEFAVWLLHIFPHSPWRCVRSTAVLPPDRQFSMNTEWEALDSDTKKACVYPRNAIIWASMVCNAAEKYLAGKPRKLHINVVGDSFFLCDAERNPVPLGGFFYVPGLPRDHADFKAILNATVTILPPNLILTTVNILSEIIRRQEVAELVYLEPLQAMALLGAAMLGQDLQAQDEKGWKRIRNRASALIRGVPSLRRRSRGKITDVAADDWLRVCQLIQQRRENREPDETDEEIERRFAAMAVQSRARA